MEKKSDIKVENSILQYKDQTYFKFFEIDPKKIKDIKNPQTDSEKTYAIAYEDLEYLDETLTFKNPKHGLCLPKEEELIQNQGLLQNYLAQIKELEKNKGDFQQLLKKSASLLENISKIIEQDEQLSKIQQKEQENQIKSAQKTVISRQFQNKTKNQKIISTDTQNSSTKGQTNQYQIENKKGEVSLSVQTHKMKTHLEKLGLKRTISDNKDRLFSLLRVYGYSNIEELGSGAFGYVVKATNQEGFQRAIKIQICDQVNDQVEFKLGRLLFYEGIENLYGNSVMTYNMQMFLDTETGLKIAMIEMELAQSTLFEFLDQKLNDSKEKLEQEITEDEFRDICEQLIGNVLCMHNLSLVHRDIKKQNILIVGNVYVLADFGVSEEIQNMEQGHIKGTDTFKISTSIGGSPLYMAPIYKKALQSKQMIVECDPFKSDLYSLGLNLLEIQLLRKGYQYSEIHQIIQNPEKAYEMALENDINQYISRGTKILSGDKLRKLKNILAWMLEIDEEKRISSIKLALIAQMDQLISSKIKMPYKQIFKPKLVKQENQGYKIDYTLKNYTYIGDITQNKQVLRNGKGKMLKANQTTIFDGYWKMDVPHGYGKYQFFQDEWYYEGGFQEGNFHGYGSINFKDEIIIKGQFQNFLLDEFFDDNKERDFQTKIVYPIKTKVNYRDKIIEIVDMQYLRIIEMDYMLIKYLGEHLEHFLRKQGNHTLRLFWKSKEKNKILFMEGENEKRVELFYEDKPTISYDEFISLHKFVGCLYYIDLQFINFDPSLNFQNFNLGMVFVCQESLWLKASASIDQNYQNNIFYRSLKGSMNKLQNFNANGILNLMLEDRRGYKVENNSLVLLLNNLCFTSIKQLYLDNTKMDANVIKEVMNTWQLNQLELLSLKNCKYMTALGFYHLHNGDNLNNLQQVFVDYNRLEIKVETKRLFKNQMKRAFQEVSFVGCNLINHEQLYRYLTLDKVLKSTKIIHLEYLALNDQIAQHIKNLTNINKIYINIETSIQLSGIMQLIRFLSCDDSPIQINLTSKNFTYSVLKHIFIQEVYLNSWQNLDFNLRIGNFLFSEIILEINCPVYHEDVNILSLPMAEISQEDENINIYDDLKKLSNSKKFLEIENLDLSPFKVDQDIINLISESLYVKNLKILDLSNSDIKNEELSILGKNNNNTLNQLRELYIDRCKQCTTAGINQLQNLPSLKFLSVKGVLITVDSIQSQKFEIIFDQIQIIGDNENEFLADQWEQLLKYNIDNLEIITMMYPAINIIKRLVQKITIQNKLHTLNLNFINGSQLQTTQQTDLILSMKELIQKLPNIENLYLDLKDWKKMGDVELKYLAESIISLSKLKKIEINMNNWAYKNNKITNLSLKDFFKSFQSNNLEVISINFERWAAWHAQISDDSLRELPRKFKFQNLLELKLNFDSWANGNIKITDNSLKEIGGVLKEAYVLRKLDLNIGKWAENNMNIGESGLVSLSSGIAQLKCLQILILNMEHWSLKSQKITDSTIKSLGNSISSLSFLKKLDFNMAQWGHNNPNISDISIKELSNMCQRLKNLKYIRLNLDGWTKKNSRITDKSIKDLANILYNIRDPVFISLELNEWGCQNQKLTPKSILDQSKTSYNFDFSQGYLTLKQQSSSNIDIEEEIYGQTI